MKYITLTRGNSKIWYPMYEVKPEYIGNGLSWNPFTIQNSSITGATSGGNIPGTIQVSFDNIFYDSLPIHASDFGSIIQTEDKFEQDPDRGGNWLKRAGGDYTEIPIGEKPEDWDTNYFDYCTIAQESYWKMWTYSVPIGGSQIDVPPTWDASTQYYKNNTSDVRQRFNHLFKTDAGFTFGIWTGTGTGYEGYNKHYSRLGTNPGATLFNNLDKFYWKYPSGSPLEFSGLVHDAVVWYSALTLMDLSPYGESGYSTNPLTNESRTYYIFVYVTYQDTTYYGIANIGLNSGGSPVNARMLLFDENLWGADSISDEEPEPSEYEFEEGPVTPSRAGGQGTFTSITINRGDRSGTYVNQLVSARETSLARAFNNYFSKVYCFDNVNDSVLGAIFGELYGTDYWGMFENLQLNPLSSILNFHLIPSSLRGENLTLQNLIIGPKDFTSDSEGAIPQIITCKTLRWYHVGDIDVSNVFTHYFDAFPDFEPYTKAILHLPYIGDISIDINSVMYGTLSVDYVCDNINGNVAAWVWCEDRDGRATYKHIATGNCSYSIPLWAQAQNGLDVGKVMGSGVGLMAGALTGNPAALISGAMGIGSALYQQSREPIHTQHTGGASGNVSYLGDHVCWLEVTRPQWVNVDDENDKPYKRGEGLPAVMKGTIASNHLKNHLSVSWVDLTNIVAATPEELAEIESLLKSGILIKE